MSMEAVRPRIRAGGVSGVLDAIAVGGGSPARALAACGLTAGDLGDPERLVDVDKVIGLFEEGARETGDPVFGLRVGLRFDFAALGPLSYAVLNAATVEQALQNFERYMHTHLEGARVALTARGH